MKNEESGKIYVIPRNFAETGRVFRGKFKTRNAIEAVIIGLIMALIVFLLPASDYTARASQLIIIAGPPVVLAINGINDGPASQFILDMITWYRHRDALLYDKKLKAQSKSPLDVMLETETARDRILDRVDDWKEKNRAKYEEAIYIEGENFRFKKDRELDHGFVSEDEIEG